MKTITMAIQGQGSSTVHDAGVIGNLLRAKGVVDLQLIPEDNWLLRLRWLKDDKVELFYEGSATPAYFDGKDTRVFERNLGPFPIQIVASAHSGASGYMVRADSGIRSIYDIKPDTRFAITKMVAGFPYALLSWLKMNNGPVPSDPGLGKWNATFVHCESWEDNLRSVDEGRADVAFATPENPIVKQAAGGKHGVRFLDLSAKSDPAGFARFRQIVPEVTLATAPREGVEAIWGLTTIVGTACIWCKPELDPGLAYELTKFLDVNYPLYKDKGNKLRTYTLECLKLVADTSMAPVHAGTVRYLREKGLWNQSNEFRQKYNSRVMDLYCSAWKSAMAAADDTGIEVVSSNPRWIITWEDQKKSYRLPAIRPMSDDEVLEGLQHLTP